MKFEKNEYGGLIIPSLTKIDDEFKIPEYSEIGEGCEIGDWCKIGPYSEIGARCRIGDGCVIGEGCRIGEACRFGEVCEFGLGCKVGDWCKIEEACKIGEGCKIGANCKIEGVIVDRFLTISNVDGTGRQLLIIWHSGGVKIRAGCFVGSDKEFLEKAKSEGKERYVRVIGAILEAEKNV